MFRKKKIHRKEGCFSYGCAEKIEQLMERGDTKTFAFHVCKHHPEFSMQALGSSGACGDFRVAEDEIPIIKKEMMKACACKKVKKVV